MSITVLAGGCAVFILSSCSKKASAAIVGKWQLRSQKDTVEFRKDGTVINSHDVTAGPPGNTRVFKEETTSQYTFTDGNHMNLQINTGDTNHPAVTIHCEVHIHGDTMDVTMAAPGESRQHKLNFKRLD